MINSAPWLLLVAGLFCGLVLGGVARWNHFCTLSALERHWFGNDSSTLQTWVLAAAVALTCTQTLQLSGIINIQDAFVLTPRFNLLGWVIGGTLFGLGMALTGTCAFGALVRLGGGSLRSLVVLIVVAITALSAQRGLLGQWRVSLIESTTIDSTIADTLSMGDLLSAWLGFPLQGIVALLCASALFAWPLLDSNYRQNSRGILTGVLVGVCVTFGWLATYLLQGQLFIPVQIESASFVMPPGDLLLNLIAFTGGFLDYGVGLALGVIAGSALVARLRHDVRWEACDDARELSRHLLGGVLMGTGGVLATGCTIGQGISAVSVMAVSAPIVFVSICLGARLGLIWLLAGPSAFIPQRR